MRTITAHRLILASVVALYFALLAGAEYRRGATVHDAAMTGMVRALERLVVASETIDILEGMTR
jgi:hypothetical protein